jgi:hypothetical protein
MTPKQAEEIATSLWANIGQWVPMPPHTLDPDEILRTLRAVFVRRGAHPGMTIKLTRQGYSVKVTPNLLLPNLIPAEIPCYQVARRF